MSFQKKLVFGVLTGFLIAGSSLAQRIGVGATVGVVNDITENFHVDEFQPRDFNGWLEVEVQEKVIARVTVGRLDMKGINAGKVVTPPSGSSSITLPDLSNHVDYGTIGVSYEFAEGTFTSGLFAGFGGYKIIPENVDESVAGYRDPHETVFGWHLGADGAVQVIPRLSFMIRLTYHNIRATTVRSLITANAGLMYRF